MLNIIIFRHGKSDWDANYDMDHNRPLSKRGYKAAKLMGRYIKKIDQISKQIYIQSKSFDEVIEMANNKSKMIASIPSIQPVANKDLKKFIEKVSKKSQ